MAKYRTQFIRPEVPGISIDFLESPPGCVEYPSFFVPVKDGVFILWTVLDDTQPPMHNMPPEFGGKPIGKVVPLHSAHDEQPNNPHPPNQVVPPARAPG